MRSLVVEARDADAHRLIAPRALWSQRHLNRSVHDALPLTHVTVYHRILGIS